ncbi:MAG: T9SS type A sorting domain-containing protein [Flavobacteriales bacterium]|nr:T9SS type A sorting domain-containing protein [Flavobacteriales bacterium]
MKHGILLSALLMGGTCTQAGAQVPNGGFESWSTPTGASYQDPDQWVTFNALTSIVPGMGLSCEKITPGAVGSAAVKVTTRSAIGIGVMPGVIAIGNMSGVTGFAYGSRPATLTGQWQCGVIAGDSGAIAVGLTKWNAATQTSESIGGAVFTFSGNVSGWQALNVPFVYTSLSTPDTAYVMVASSIGSPSTGGSWVQVDALAFSGTATGIAEQAPEGLRVYPSPASNRVTISGAQPMARITLFETTGRTMLSQGVGGTTAELDVAHLPQGRYLVRVELVDGTQSVSSFVKR